LGDASVPVSLREKSARQSSSRYAQAIPTINQRTVNETAAVVAFLNNNYLTSQ